MQAYLTRLRLADIPAFVTARGDATGCGIQDFTSPDGTPGINGGLLKRQHPITGIDGVIAYVCTMLVENVDAVVEKATRLAANEMRVAQAGQWFVHGAAVRLCDRLGLYTVEAYFPSALRLKVLPRSQPRVALPVARLAAGAPDQRLGAHTLRQRGLGGELRELREYVPGDPFKLIAWKASARAPFGLAGAVLSGDLDRGLAVANRIRTGSIGVNGGMFYSADAPFGGFGASGIGRQCGIEGFEQYLETRTIAYRA
mgnify:CR=1 FL=1